MSNEAAWAYHLLPEGTPGYACELGALDGVYLSNTLLLEQKGWTVLCIEPSPVHHEALAKNRKLVLRCACDQEPKARSTLYQMGHWGHATHAILRPERDWPSAHQLGHTTEFPTTVLTLDQCLEIVGFPRLDVLSLDVDGIERSILAGFDLKRWSPLGIIIEEGTERCMSDCLPGYEYVRREGENGLYRRIHAA